MRNKINLQLFNYKLLKISVMKNFYKLLMVMLAFTFAASASAQLEGAYKIAPEAGALGVGPGQGDISWWSNSLDDVTTRACFFDDVYLFNTDGTFENILDDNTWLEPWQGVDPEACGTPIAPHDGMGDYTFTYDAGAGTVTIAGTGGYLGLPKVTNNGELGSPGDAPESITYIVDIQDGGDVLVIDIDFGGGWWRFKMVADDYTPPAGDFDGMWQMAQMAGAMGVGPGQGDISWWSNSVDDLSLRACFFDDYYVFNGDGSFSNMLQDETWIEEWQGASEAGCGVPVAPHDGTVAATWAYDEGAGTVTLTGTGAYLGIPKAVNGSELGSPGDAPESVTYIVGFEEDGDMMVLDIEAGTGVWWRFRLSYMGPVGISELENENVSIYPNPAQDYINISEDYISAKIYNINGSLVMDVLQNQTQIDVSNLSSGVYFIQMNTIDGHVKQSKFVKK